MSGVKEWCDYCQSYHPGGNAHLLEAESSLAAPTGSTPKGVDHLKMAQKAFEEWLRELDSTLQNSELAFDEYAGAIRNNDLEQAKDSMYRATQSLRMARLAIKAGLDAGV